MSVSSTSAKDDYHTVDLTEGFRAQPYHLFEALTNAGMVSMYTRAPAKIDAKVGGEFSLFDGQITGRFIELSSPHRIVQAWRFKEWREGEFSTVTIDLTAPTSDTCKLTLHQTHVPEHDKYGNRDVPSKVEQGWQEFILSRIQQVLGYGKQPV